MNIQLLSLKNIVEALLFASQKPLSAKELISIIRGVSPDQAHGEMPDFTRLKEPELRAVLDELLTDCQELKRTYEVRETASGWQLLTKAEFAPWLRQLFPENRLARLSAPALETLAIIAYRQPITRAHIEAVRGVAVDGVMQTLLDRGLVRIGGRAEVPGRPLLYETTQYFMEHFGLKSLDDLPNSSELRRIDLPPSNAPDNGVPSGSSPAASSSAESMQSGSGGLEETEEAPKEGP